MFSFQAGTNNLFQQNDFSVFMRTHADWNKFHEFIFGKNDLFCEDEARQKNFWLGHFSLTNFKVAATGRSSLHFCSLNLGPKRKTIFLD